ncbi:hypothetical protein BO78DRAFT_424433 [Aspergillus sclerotiicarbonarius CBS 121057]|uniref:Uncharacterized protein n=1 Tax=Aspergillus sclerotiicarbonarius (strain CBS 121057 / IBT 28362) TaxID=1448318 RepID=A0A319DSV1_ASPSB|nr:hypothetical protein BO78DRAFT_424433 [Aspergillus sclerotiicarbonarius CBS 121057]
MPAARLILSPYEEVGTSQISISLAYKATHQESSESNEETMSRSSSGLSAFTVKQIDYRMEVQPSCWTLDGPHIIYCEPTLNGVSPTNDEPENGEHQNVEPEDVETENLGDLVARLQRLHGDDKVQCIQDPHGRDALRHFFKDQCPLCGGSGWIYRYVSGMRMDCSLLFGSHANKIACPVCLGNDCARPDAIFSGRVGRVLHNVDKNWETMTVAEMRTADKTTERLTRLRCQDINLVREEMGMELIDVEEEVEVAINRVWGNE